MQSLPYRYRKPLLACRSLAGSLAVVALCASQAAWSQQPTPNAIQILQAPAVPAERVPFFTPQAVREGRAVAVSHYNPEQKLRLALNLQPPHLAEEDAFIEQLVTKGSPGFHKFLSQDEWNARFAPSAADEQAVVDWAQSAGLTVTQRYPNRLLVDVEGTAGTIEKAFGVTINNYQVGNEVDFSNDRDPVIPANLTRILSAVVGLNSIERVHRLGSSRPTVKGADYVAGPAITPLDELKLAGDPTKAPWKKPATIAGKEKVTAASTGFGSQDSYPLDDRNGTYAMDPSNVQSSQGYDYNALQRFSGCCNVPGNSAGSPPESSIALVGYGGYNSSDILTFFEAYGMAAYVTPYCIDGSTCPGNDGEAPLDVEYSGAMSNSYGSYLDTAHIYEYEMTNDLWSTYEDAYNDVLSGGHAKVLSTSYGGNEDSNSTSAGIETGTMHSILNNMVAAGITLVAASGDEGAAAGCGDATAVQYPSSDPDFLAAGGTQLNMYTDGVFYSETAWQGESWSGACGSNHGGSTGGRSVLFAAPSWQKITNSTYPNGVESPYYSWQTVNGVTTEYINTNYNARLVPDLSLTANPDVLGQWYYSGGSWQSEGGTSIVAPELAGFFAQENSYLDKVGSVCGSGSTACSPLGLAATPIYQDAIYGAPHNPFYDMTSGCNNNDITVADSLFYFCAYAGYDPITGWGSANMMQLGWGINWWLIPAVGTPSLSFGGPSINTWYNTDQIVDWDLDDSGGGYPAPGALGFTLGWDSIPSDPQSEAHGGDGNSFYAGPQYLSTFGCVDNNGTYCEAASGQGCHTVYVEGWDNQGRTTTGSYGPVCYDSVAPVTADSLSGTVYGSVYDSAVKVTLSATDATSGVAATYYSIDGGSYATYGGAFTVSALGAHTVSFYSKDNAGNAESAKSVSFTISSLTTTTVSSSANPSGYGQSVTFTATVAASLSGTPTGSVEFVSNGTVIGTVALSGGTASFSTILLTAESHTVKAEFLGNVDFIASNSASITQVVNKANTTLALAASVNPSQYNQPVTFTATVSGQFGAGPSGGTVTFYKNGTSIGTGTLSGGKATFTISTLTAQTHTITATYPGDTNFNASTSPNLSEVTNAAATTTALASTPNPSSYGQPITLTATVAPAYGGTATGTVTFNHLSTVLGTATLSGNVATLKLSNLPVGSSHITATYGGSTDYLTSTSAALTQSVQTAATTTTIASSSDPSISGSPVTFTANVSALYGGTPTGSVTFKQGATVLGTGTLNSSGNATFTTSALTVGTHSIVAYYNGSSTDANSNSTTLSQVVNQ
jgi:hypothetical protein